MWTTTSTSKKQRRGESGGTRRRPSHGGHMGDGGYSMNFNMSSPRGPLPVKKATTTRSGGPLPERSTFSGPVGSSSRMGRRAPVSGGRDMEAHLEGSPCLLVEMFMCPQEMTDILRKTAVQIEITQILVTQVIIHHHQEIILNVTMLFPVHWWLSIKRL